MNSTTAPTILKKKCLYLLNVKKRYIIFTNCCQIYGHKIIQFHYKVCAQASSKFPDRGCFVLLSLPPPLSLLIVQTTVMDRRFTLIKYVYVRIGMRVILHTCVSYSLSQVSPQNPYEQLQDATHLLLTLVTIASPWSHSVAGHSVRERYIYFIYSSICIRRFHQETIHSLKRVKV